MDRDVELVPFYFLSFSLVPKRPAKDSWRRRLASIARCRPIEFTYMMWCIFFSLPPSSGNFAFNRINKKFFHVECTKMPATSWSYTLAPICLFYFCFFLIFFLLFFFFFILRLDRNGKRIGIFLGPRNRSGSMRARQTTGHAASVLVYPKHKTKPPPPI